MPVVVHQEHPAATAALYARARGVSLRSEAHDPLPPPQPPLDVEPLFEEYEFDADDGGGGGEARWGDAESSLG
jgi:hypothetical protein